MKQQSQRRWIVTASLAALLAFGPMAAAFADQDEPLKKAIVAGWRMWRDLQVDMNTMTFSVGAGYIGDTSSGKALYKLDVNAGLAKGGYPNDFHFDMASYIQLKRTGSKTDYVENVTTLRVNYERNLFPMLKAYGFVERFTDTYLDIQQRYETGLGLKLEAEIGLTTIGKKRLKELAEFHQAVNAGRERNVAVSDDVAQALTVDDAQFDEMATAVKKKNAFLALGLACTVLSELERAELDMPDGSKKTIDPQRRGRIAIRPGITWQPAEGVSLKWQTYFKLPAFGPTDAAAFNGALVYDLRTDTFVTLRYDLPKSPAWARRVSLLVEYKDFKDRLPPYIPGVVVAPADHSSIVFKIGVDF